jgi:hypothetical protein
MESNFLSAVSKHLNYTETQNGAVTNKSSLDDCVNFFAQGGSIRSRSESEIIALFAKAFAQDKTIAVRLMYMFRDVRGGQGQRRPFRIQLNWLAQHYPEQTRPLIDLVSEYGRWDDVYSVANTACEQYALGLMKKQVSKDLDGITANQPISILGKWLKRINTSSVESVKLGNATRQAFGLTAKDYRKLCSHLNRYLEVAENRMSRGEWDKIEYSKLPSQCLLKHRKAFSRNDSERYMEFIDLAKQGKVNVNASTLYPYQIVSKIISSWTSNITPDEAEVLWNNLPQIDVDNNAIVVADVSGSMTGLPMEVCISLAIYFAGKSKGPYHDKFITFSVKPTLQTLKGANIFEKVHNLTQAEWGMTTNLELVFDVILQAAVSEELRPDDMVGTIYIISDMEFNSITKNQVRQEKVETFYDSIRDRFTQHGYTIPKLVFWNVNANPGNFPVVHNTPNTCMISGFSPNILKYITGEQNEILTPEGMMLEVVNSPRYSNINF